MERITSRKNSYIARIRMLAKDPLFRNTEQEYLCDGWKLLEEAIHAGQNITSVLWKEHPSEHPELAGVKQMVAPEELFDYASPMANSPGPLFTVQMKKNTVPAQAKHFLVLENVQDPGNVGTVIRTANAFCIDAVILTGDCADLYHPKTVRASMGAIFRQNTCCLAREELPVLFQQLDIPLYGAVLSARAKSIRQVELSRCAVAVGSEGRGLTAELIAMCDGEVIIPMNPDSESLNAAVAASVLMWEMNGREL